MTTLPQAILMMIPPVEVITEDRTMADRMSVVVFFNDESLEGQRRFDREARSGLARRGAEKLRECFPDAVFGDPNATACSVSITGRFDVVQDVIDYLGDHAELGHFMIDGPMLRPAS